jgi:hypothetical protein
MLTFMRQYNLNNKFATYSLSYPMPWTVIPRLSWDDLWEIDGRAFDKDEGLSLRESKGEGWRDRGELKHAETNRTWHQSNTGIWIDSADFTCNTYCRLEMADTEVQYLFIKSLFALAFVWWQCVNHFAVWEGKIVQRTSKIKNNEAPTSLSYTLLLQMHLMWDADIILFMSLLLLHLQFSLHLQVFYVKLVKVLNGA